MPTYQLIIAPAAIVDLKSIYQYGLRRWGKAQSDSYIENIKTQFWLLTTQPLMGIERPELLNNIRSQPIQSHTVFYRVTTNQIEIVRLLHSRQDPQGHLK